MEESKPKGKKGATSKDGTQRPKATRNTNLLAKSVPVTCLHDFKIPFFVRRKREEQRAKQLLAAKQAMAKRGTKECGAAELEFLRLHPVGSGLPPDEISWVHDGAQNREGDELEGDDSSSTGGARAELRRRLRHNVRTVPSTTSSPAPFDPHSAAATAAATSPAEVAHNTGSAHRKRPRDYSTSPQRQQQRMQQEAREREREAVVATSAQRAVEAAKAKKVAVAAAAVAAMATLTPMRAERAMRYAHMCGRFAEVFATHVWPFKPLHPASWDDTTVRLVIDKGTLIAGEDEWSTDCGDDGALKDNRVLALAVFTALALGAQACGANEAALSLYEQARSHLALLFDTCDIRVAETLIALQYLAFGFGDLTRAAYYNMTALCIFNRLKAFDSDMYRRCMWSVHLLPNTSYGDRKRLMREYRQNTSHLPCWNDDTGDIRLIAPPAANTREGSLYREGTASPLRGEPQRPPTHYGGAAQHPHRPEQPAVVRYDEQAVDVQQFGWGTRVLGTEKGYSQASCTPSRMPAAPAPITTSPETDDGEFGGFSYCSADFSIYPTPTMELGQAPSAPPQYSHPSLLAPSYNNPSLSMSPSFSSVTSSMSSSPSSSSSSPQTMQPGLTYSSSSSSSSSSTPLSTSSSTTSSVLLLSDEFSSHFASPEREIFHARYTSYQATEENARFFLHTMIILSVLDAKASRKAEGDPKRARIFKRMADKASAFERHLRRYPAGSIPTSYFQSVMLIMISARADCYWRMHDEVFTLVALQDFLSTCRSIDMRLCASTALPSFNAVIHIMQQLDQSLMLAELLQLMAGPARLFPSWGQACRLERRPCS